MADREKELTILVAEGCLFTAEMLPYWEYCRNLALRMHRHLGGGMSIRFSTLSDLLCEFRWRGKHVATLYFHGVAPGEVRIHTASFANSDLPRVYSIAQVWETAFQPAIASLLFEERQTLDEVERKIRMALP